MRFLAWVALSLFTSVSIYAQSASGTVRGTVVDPSGAAVSSGVVEIHNPVSHYDQSVKTDNQGNFSFSNVPYNNYHLTAIAPGFQRAQQDIDLRSPVPVELKFALKIGEASTTVTVEAGADLIETDPEIHTDVDRNLFDKLPLESSLLLAQFTGHAGHPRRVRRLQWPLSRNGRSRLEFVLHRRPADHRSAKQGILQSASRRCRAIDGSDRGCAACRIRR